MSGLDAVKVNPSEQYVPLNYLMCVKVNYGTTQFTVTECANWPCHPEPLIWKEESRYMLPTQRIEDPTSICTATGKYASINGPESLLF